MTDKIFVVGIGVVSPYGNSLDEYFRGLLSQKSVQRTSNRLDIVRFDAPPAIEVNMPCPDGSPEERIINMGAMAIESALLDWGGILPDERRVGLIIGSGLGLTDQLYTQHEHYKGTTYLSSLGEKLATNCGIKCETIYVGNACCAGGQAISFGADLLKSESLDLVIAGGIDILSPTAYAGFLRLNAIDSRACRPFDKERRGIMVGEGTAFFVLVKETKSDENPKKAYCYLAGSGTSNDAYHIVQMRPEGTEIINAMEQALCSAELTKDDVDIIIAHGTGTIQNDKIESEAIQKYFGEHLSNVYVTAPKGAIGHTGGASGAFGFLTAIGSITHKTVPAILNLETVDPDCRLRLVHRRPIECEPRVVMVNAFAFGGTNVVIICERLSGEESCSVESG